LPGGIFLGAKILSIEIITLVRVCGKKLFLGAGCGVWGFIDFEVVNYLIFREKVPEFSPRSLQWSALFEEKKSKSLIQQGFQIYSASPS
jgi:hypothetical protein